MTRLVPLHALVTGVLVLTAACGAGEAPLGTDSSEPVPTDVAETAARDVQPEPEPERVAPPPEEVPEGWPVAVVRADDAPVDYERVVLVTIDTLRADHVSCYGYPRETTPFLDSLAARGVRFDRAMAAISHTAPSHATMLTGLVPAVHGVVKNGNKLDPEARDLAALLGTVGFESAAFLNVRFLQGVATSFGHVDASLTAVSGPGKPTGEDVVQRAITWLRKDRKGGRFLLWVHLYDPHNWNEDIQDLALGKVPEWTGTTPDGFVGTLAELHGLTPPGDDPEAWRVEWHLEREPQGVDMGDPRVFQASIDAYDERTRFADRQVERLYGALEGLGLPGRTLWIVTSDHGEGLAGHGVAGHGSRIYQEQLHVPLIVHASDGSLGPRAVDALVGHVDLYPTVAETVGGRVIGHPRLYEGRSLWPLIRGETAWAPRTLFAQRKPAENAASREIYALQDESHKVILHVGGDGEEAEVFDVANDPRELKELGSGTAAAEVLRKALEARLRDYAGLSGEAADEEVPEEWLQELKDLGYVR